MNKAKLTEVQQRVFSKLTEKWITPKELGTDRGVLNKLVELDLAEFAVGNSTYRMKMEEWKERVETQENEDKAKTQSCFGKLYLAGDNACKLCDVNKECHQIHKANNTHVCYVCGKKGMGYQYIGLFKVNDKVVSLYRCKGMWCQFRVIKGVDKTKINEEGFIPPDPKETFTVPLVGGKTPYISKLDILVKMLKENPRTMEEMVEAVQSTPASIMGQFYFIKKQKDLDVIKVGETYTIKEEVDDNPNHHVANCQCEYCLDK